MAFVMRKHRKRLLLVSVLLAAALVLTMILLPRNEPKYQDRYLSEWVADLRPDATVAQREAARQAVVNIGTNCIPAFVEWLGADTPKWKIFFYRMLPSRLQQNLSVANWARKDVIRAGQAMEGIWLLGTNAAGAIPQLDYQLRHRTDEDQSRSRLWGFMVIHALAGIGVDSAPVLKAAFADPKQSNRYDILWSLRWLALNGHTNECMPSLLAALEDQDPKVRARATNLLQVVSTNELYRALN